MEYDCTYSFGNLLLLNKHIVWRRRMSDEEKQEREYGSLQASRSDADTLIERQSSLHRLR